MWEEVGVVAVLRPSQPVDPGVWAIARSAPRVHGQHLVDDLRLPVRLAVEGGAEAKLYVGYLEQIAPHVAGEDRVAIADHGPREAMEPNDAVKEGVGDKGGSVGVAERDEVHTWRSCRPP